LQHLVVVFRHLVEDCNLLFHQADLPTLAAELVLNCCELVR
jgi:hypothetical protein